MTGRVAVVITCHDLGRTLVQAVESVERQTRPAAEIVVVDDGSIDVYTQQVLAQLETRATRVVRIDAGSASAARNCGIRQTAADYLVCLDADDVLDPGYLQAAAARLDQEPDLDFVSSGMRAFGGATYLWKPAVPTFVDAVATGGVPHASTMIRRRLWEAVGGFDETLPSYELLDFWATAFEQGARGVILDEPFLNYRVRPGSGYRRSIHADAYLARLRHFYAKHRGAVARHGLELIAAKEAFLQSQRDYQRTLRARIAALEEQREQVRHEIGRVTGELAKQGRLRVEWGDFRRRAPFSRHWGWDRGTPIDRYYIERFLESNREAIRGRVLEVHDPVYTRRFGGDAVTVSDVIDLDPGNSAATKLGDLRRAAGIPSDSYDAIIVTQTLQLVDDVDAALSECARLLKPGGALLVTVPCTIRVDDEAGQDGDFWRLTEASARRLFARVFPADAFEVTTFGNVKVCAAFLYGISTEEMDRADLDHVDENFPLLIAVRAVKREAAAELKPETAGLKPETAGLKPCASLETVATVAQDLPAAQHGAQGFSAAPTVAQGFSPAGYVAQDLNPARQKPSNKGVVLAYHRIADLTPDSHRLCVSPEEFRRHMAYIREACTPMSLDALVRAAASGRIPDRAVAVTFDDGYLDALSTASPVLCEFGIPATFFVNSDRLDEPHERWWDVLERIFLTDVALPPTFSPSNGLERPSLRTTTPGERAAALEWLNRRAWPLDADGRRAILRDVLDWSGREPTARDSHRVLTSDELRALAAKPEHTIGSHTIHHLALTMQAPDAVAREIRDDKAALERVIGRPVDLFAYPYGDFDGAVVAAAADSGFRAAVTVDVALVAAGGNRLLIPRCEVNASWQGGQPDRLAGLFERAAVV